VVDGRRIKEGFGYALGKKRVIVFAPHPDDETLGCGGTIAKKIAEGCEVLIVVMTDGRFLLTKSLGIDGDPSPEQVKEIRRGEVLRAVKILGVPEENAVFLDFVDKMLEENEREAQKKVVEILRKYWPSEVYFPYERDCHPDHRVTNRVVRKAIERLGITPLTYRYIILHKFARVGPFIERFLNVFKRNMIHVNISEFLPLKEAAVKEFRSELTIISPRQSKPRTKSFKKFLKKEETFYIDK
jgi:LmbE family N-acetylglucosaminyl deacetylase